MKKSFVVLVTLSFIVLPMAGRSVYAASDSTSASQPASQHAQSQDQNDSSLSGKVIETMTSGGYTYALIENNGQKTWVAVPATKISVGQQVSFRPGVAMGAFESKTLNRKFDNIIFSSGLLGQAPMAHGTEMTSEKHTVETTPAKKMKIEKAQGPNAYTINELIKKSAQLDNHPVVVRGEVIKVSEQIMGKNWFHIVDNSATANLVVTSQDLPKVGDVVTVSGTLHKDKDFGSGYKYPVIIEDAAIK
jgi:hypothetical protein